MPPPPTSALSAAQTSSPLPSPFSPSSHHHQARCCTPLRLPFPPFFHRPLKGAGCRSWGSKKRRGRSVPVIERPTVDEKVNVDCKRNVSYTYLPTHSHPLVSIPPTDLHAHRKRHLQHLPAMTALPGGQANGRAAAPPLPLAPSPTRGRRGGRGSRRR